MNSGLLNLGLSAAASLLLVSANHAAASVDAYNFTDLGTLGGSRSFAYAINNAGQVAGWASTAENAERHATVWKGNTATDLGTLGGTNSIAYAINNAGQVAGESSITNNTAERATLWNGSTATDLGTLGGTNSRAYAINNAGQVAGEAFTLGDAAFHATLWNGAVATDLSARSGDDSRAYAINDTGQVVGIVFGVVDDTSRATVWNGTAATDLSSQNPLNSEARAINNTGQIVGYAGISGNVHATFWHGSTETSLGSLGNNSSVAAWAINNSGEIVGSDGALAYLWADGKAIPLVSLMDANAASAGWIPTSAHGINDKGWVVGEALNTLSHERHAFLMTPVPEAEIYVMLLAGLSLLGLTYYRREIN